MNDAPHDGRHDRTRERAARVIYEAPIGEYVGREGAEVLAQYAGEERSLADREMLYRAGDPSDAFFIVTDGRLALVREGNEQNPEVIIHVLERGDLIGEQSFLGGTRHATSCVALGAARVLQFRVDDMTPLIEQHPRVLYDFMRGSSSGCHTAASINRQRLALEDYLATAGRRH
ncbi:MAG: cyclic nucleotide-binding domain-containing protein [Nocardioides sp.]